MVTSTLCSNPVQAWIFQVFSCCYLNSITKTMITLQFITSEKAHNQVISHSNTVIPVANQGKSTAHFRVIHFDTTEYLMINRNSVYLFLNTTSDQSLTSCLPFFPFKAFQPSAGIGVGEPYFLWRCHDGVYIYSIFSQLTQVCNNRANQTRYTRVTQKAIELWAKNYWSLSSALLINEIMESMKTSRQLVFILRCLFILSPLH